MTNDEMHRLREKLLALRSAEDRYEAAGTIIRWKRLPYDPDNPVIKERAAAEKEAEDLHNELDHHLPDLALNLIIMIVALQSQLDQRDKKIVELTTPLDWTTPQLEEAA